MIKNDEIFVLDRLRTSPRPQSQSPTPRTDVHRQHSLLLKVMTHLLNILTDQDRFDYLAAWLGILTCKFHCGVYCPSPCTTSTPGGTLKSNNEDRRPVLVRILKKMNSDRDPSECANRRRRIW